MTEPTQAFETWVSEQQVQVERALARWVGADAGFAALPTDLPQAMRYAVLGGGKRLRPLLVLAAAQAGGLDGLAPAHAEGALRAACAVELVHAYSLVHDDLPCMDNDVLRRGKPTLHVQFGEATALLAGDALQALAFELLSAETPSLRPAQQAKLCHLLASAAGCAGMAGGQAIDLASVGLRLSEAQLRQMHQLKTGALLQASVLMGAVCAGGFAAAAQAALHRFGTALGLAFQVVDDVLDVTANSATLGKTAGKDASTHKPTYVSVLGLAESVQYARALLQEALHSLSQSALPHTQALQGLAGMLVHRIC